MNASGDNLGIPVSHDANGGWCSSDSWDDTDDFIVLTNPGGADQEADIYNSSMAEISLDLSNLGYTGNSKPGSVDTRTDDRYMLIYYHTNGKIYVSRWDRPNSNPNHFEIGSGADQIPDIGVGRNNIALGVWINSSPDLTFQVIGNNQTTLGSQTTLDVMSGFTQSSPRVGVNDIQFVVTWESGTATNSHEIYAAKYQFARPEYSSGLDNKLYGQKFDLVFSFTFTDPEGAGLTYSAKQSNGSSLPFWLSFNPSVTFSGTTPSLSDCNSQTWSIKVNSSESCQLTNDYTFDIEVQDTALTVDQGIPNQQVSANTSGWNYQFPLNTFNDPENATLIYESTLSDDSLLPFWLTFDGASRTFSGDVSEDNCGEILNIKVIANDSCNPTISTIFDLNITNEAPQVNQPIPNQQVSSNTSG